MCIPRTNRIFRTISEGNRPWITVVDGFGFPDPWVNAYVTFLAWQDATPYHVRRQAAILAEAATWLTQNDATWARMPLNEWAFYCLLMMPHTPRHMQTHIETLHHFYAFWHWYHPQQMPVQPFPATHRDRTEWLTRVLTDTQDLPYPLPF